MGLFFFCFVFFFVLFFIFSKKISGTLLSNGLDPDQARHFVDLIWDRTDVKVISRQQMTSVVCTELTAKIKYIPLKP